MTEDRIAELEALLETARRRAEEETARAIRAEEKAQRMAVEVGIRDAVAKSAVPVHPAALPDLIKRASAAEWQEVGGKLVQMDSGMPALDSLGHDLTPANWLKNLQSEAPHLFSAPADSVSAASRNPFSRESWNMTEQGRIAREDPDRARQLAQAAGRKLEA